MEVPLWNRASSMFVFLSTAPEFVQGRLGKMGERWVMWRGVAGGVSYGTGCLVCLGEGLRLVGLVRQQRALGVQMGP